MKVQLNDLEARFPIDLVQGDEAWVMTFRQAKTLLSELRESVWKIEQRFRCVGRYAAFRYSTSKDTVRCDARGSVKQPDGTYLCKRHAKKAAKEPK